MYYPKFSRLALVSVVLLGAGSLQAQDAERAYDASVSLGYVGTTGNTETTTFNTEVLFTLRQVRWTHNMKLQGLAVQENEVTRAERYYLENKSDFALDEDQYLYGKGSYNDDRFSGFDYQATVSAGYGRYLLRRDTLDLQGFVGAGYRENSVTNGDSEGEGIVSVGENFNWRISDNAKLVQSFISDIGEELTVSRFEVGLESNIIDRIATKIAFQWRNTSEVPVGNKKTDTQTSVSLVYSF